LRQIFSYFALLIALLISLSPGTYAKRNELVSMPLNLDNKSWLLNSQSRMGIFYTPQGQSIQNWTELITLQFYPNYKKTSAKEFMSHYLGHLRQSEPTVKSKYISNSPNSAIIEWSISKSRHCPNQCGLDRALRGPQGLHVIHYAIKTNKWSETERKKWLNIINRTKIT
jgi:hypothetical protein